MLADAGWPAGTDIVMCGWRELIRNGISWTPGGAWGGMSSSADTHWTCTSSAHVAMAVTRREARAPTGWQRTHATEGVKDTVR